MRPHALAACLAALWLAAGLAGCSAPPTVSAPLTCPVRLAGGERCTALVQAQAWQSPTGIRVQRGETYCVQVPPGQAWQDWHRPNVPPHGEPGNWLMQRFNHLKRHPDSDWFALVAAVQPADPAAPAPHQDLSRAPLLRASETGMLVLYPNDAVSPLGDPLLFYNNNSGRIQVSVQRCAGPCACPVAPPR